MSNKPVILNASPFIVLCNAELLQILPALFAPVAMPQAVRQEILNVKRADLAAETLPRLEWLTHVTVELAPEVAQWDLGAGESEVVSFALTHSDYLAIVDDRAAKKCAAALNVNTLGTGAALILAKRHGLIASVTHALTALRANGLWISDAVMQTLAKQAGEA